MLTGNGWSHHVAIAFLARERGLLEQVGAPVRHAHRWTSLVRVARRAWRAIAAGDRGPVAPLESPLATRE